MERLGLGDWLTGPRHGAIEGFSIRAKTAHFAARRPTDLRATRGCVVRRREFEPKVLEKALSAGAALHEGVEVRRFLRSSSGEVRGVEAGGDGETMRFEAPLVVISSGASEASRAGARRGSRRWSSRGSTSRTPPNPAGRAGTTCTFGTPRR